MCKKWAEPIFSSPSCHFFKPSASLGLFLSVQIEPNYTFQLSTNPSFNQIIDRYFAAL
uniref:Uncharacterized protein n=1 Tax=Manihot esculenta TaxID=3983 RepID=A0A2C9W9H7_MANES